MTKPVIKIKFEDFGDTAPFYTGYFVNLLSLFADVQICDDPDYLFYSIYGSNHLNYECIKIYYMTEELEPDFNECDYAIGYTDIAFYDRYLYLPLFAYPASVERTKRALARKNVSSNTKFCNFIYSNGLGDPFREQVFHALSQYKHVDSAGRYLNNMGNVDIAGSRSSDNYEESKINFLGDYRFTIAMSNAQKFGYLDEKIFDAWIAGSVPVYWGDPKITELFNPESFIDCTRCTSVAEVVEKVKEIEEDPVKFSAMQRAPVTLDVSKVEVYFDESRIVDFLKNIFMQSYEYAGRTSKGIHYNRHMKEKKLVTRITGSFGYKVINKIQCIKTKIGKHICRT